MIVLHILCFDITYWYTWGQSELHTLALPFKGKKTSSKLVKSSVLQYSLQIQLSLLYQTSQTVIYKLLPTIYEALAALLAPLSHFILSHQTGAKHAGPNNQLHVQLPLDQQQFQFPVLQQRHSSNLHLETLPTIVLSLSGLLLYEPAVLQRSSAVLGAAKWLWRSCGYPGLFSRGHSRHWNYLLLRDCVLQDEKT